MRMTGASFGLRGIAGLAAAVLMIALGGGAALADADKKAGTLTCTATGGAPFVAGRTKELDCIFQPVGEDAVDTGFTGTIRRYGFEVAPSEKIVVVWDVLVPSRPVSQRTIAGTYRGVVDPQPAAPPILTGGYMDRVKLVPVTIPAGQPRNGAAAIAEMELVARPLKA